MSVAGAYSPFDPDMYQHQAIPAPLDENSIYTLLQLRSGRNLVVSGFWILGSSRLMLAHSEQVNAKIDFKFKEGSR